VIGKVDCDVAIVEAVGGSVIGSASLVVEVEVEGDAVVVVACVVTGAVDDALVVGAVVGGDVVCGATLGAVVGDKVVEATVGHDDAVQASVLFEQAPGVVGHCPRQFPSSEHEVSAGLSPTTDVKALWLRLRLFRDGRDDRSSAPCRPQPAADSVCSFGNEKV
jgi:hypothetical protein